jgi:hypothetical protein
MNVIERLKAPDFWAAHYHEGGQFSREVESAPFDAAAILETVAKALDHANMIASRPKDYREDQRIRVLGEIEDALRLIRGEQ